MLDKKAPDQNAWWNKSCNVSRCRLRLDAQFAKKRLSCCVIRDPSLPDTVANIYQNNKVQWTHQCYSILPPFITSNPRWLETDPDTRIVNCKKHFAWRGHVSLNTMFYTPTMVKQFTFRSSLFWEHKSVGFKHPPSKAGKHNAHCWTNSPHIMNEFCTFWNCYTALKCLRAEFSRNSSFK